MEKIWQELTDRFMEWNWQINLSAIRNPDDIYIKHIMDSIKLNDFFLFPKNSKIVDIWTWWWFPLLPLAITNSDSHFTGIETRNKKVTAVNDIAQKLGITNAKVIWSRIEEHKEKYDFLTARAVWMVDKILPISYELLKKWWKFIFFKMQSEDEQKLFNKMIKKYNLKIISKNEYTLFDWDIPRIIRILQK